MRTTPLISCILACFFISSIATSAPAANTIDPAQKKQVESTIHDYIIQNPEVIVEALQGYQQKQMAEQSKKFEKIQENAPKYANQLFHQATDPVIGNVNGKITLVAFLDYQCPHCIDMTAIIEELIKSNPDLRVVSKEFPIRGPMSELATRAALAAQKQGKYFEMHKALMTSKTEPLTEDVIYDLAKSASLDLNQLKIDMKSKAVDEQIKANYQTAKELQIMFTPVFFVAKSDIQPNAKTNAVAFIPGQITAAQLKDVIKKIGG